MGAAPQFEELSLPAHWPPGPAPSAQIRWPGAFCQFRFPPGAGQAETVLHGRVGNYRSRCRTLLMSGGTDGRLYWWDIDRGTSPIVVPAHEGWIHSIQVSPDGGMVASSGEDGAIQ